jgi:hypothetical protein
VQAYESDRERGPRTHAEAMAYVREWGNRLEPRWQAIGNVLVEPNGPHAEIFSFSGRETNPLFVETEPGRFAELGALLGAARAEDSRGLVAADLDLDGDEDIVLRNAFTNPVVLLRNEEGAAQNGVTIRLRGSDCNTHGIGAIVRLTCGRRTITKPVVCGGSYLACPPPVAHFGMREAAEAADVEIQWPCGRTDRTGPVRAGAIVEIREGAGVVRRVPYRTPAAVEPFAPPRTVRRGDRFVLQLSSSRGRTRTIPGGRPVLLHCWMAGMVAPNRDVDAYPEIRAALDPLGVELCSVVLDPVPKARAHDDLSRRLMEEFWFGDVWRGQVLSSGRPVVPVGILLDADGTVLGRRVGALGAGWGEWVRRQLETERP